MQVFVRAKICPDPCKCGLSSSLHGARVMLVLSLPAFENKTNKKTAYARFHGNGPYGEIPTVQGQGVKILSILDNKTSNKRFVIQQGKLFCSCV